MSNDPTARFLFAILKQKDLKDIDWNKVARDPVLPQSISNGHAARMRYHRFRNSVLGVEPRPRNGNKALSNNNATKANRVTKSRKKPAAANKPIKAEDQDDFDSGASPSPGPADPAAEIFHSLISTTTAGFKEEPMFIAPSSSSSRTSQQRMHSMRLLTPCSDSETALGGGGGPVSAYSPSPVPTTPFDFTGQATPAQDPWQTSYGNFGAEFEIGGYGGASSSSGTASMFGNNAEEALGVHTAMLEHERGVVKHEEWDGISGGNTGGGDGHYQHAGHC